jgi:small subunit ribosomal protein S20
MANTSSAKKAERAALRKRVFNARRKKSMKDSLRDISKLILAKSADKAVALLPTFQKAVDKAAKQGVLKGNTAARMKSRIAKQIRAITK